MLLDLRVPEELVVLDERLLADEPLEEVAVLVEREERARPGGRCPRPRSGSAPASAARCRATESSRSLTSITVGRDPSRSITRRASASPAEIRVPPRNVAFQGLAIPNVRGRSIRSPNRRRRVVSKIGCGGGSKNGSSASSSFPRVPEREHLVGDVREDDEPEPGRRLGERPQDALDALVLARLDARREVEDDHAAAPGGEVARRAGAEPPRREHGDRDERERSDDEGEPDERRPPRGARELARGGRRQPGPALRADHARLPFVAASASRSSSSTTTALGVPDDHASARARSARSPRPRAPSSRATRSKAFRRSGESPSSEASRASWSARSSGVARVSGASSSSTASTSSWPQQPPDQPDPEQGEQRARDDEPRGERAGRAREGDGGERRRVGAPALGRERLDRHAGRHLERRPVDDRGALALRRPEAVEDPRPRQLDHLAVALGRAFLVEAAEREAVPEADGRGVLGPLDLAAGPSARTA